MKQMKSPIDLSLFPSSPFPGDRPVVDAAKANDGWERDAVSQLFAGKSIRDLTPAAVKHFPHDLSTCHHLLSAEAFAFFLPGLLNLVLSDRDDDQVALLGDSLVNTLLRMASREMDYRLGPLLQQYSKEQLAVVACFLEEVARIEPYPIPEKDPARNALRLFWDQYHRGA